MQTEHIELTPKGRRTRSALVDAAGTIIGREGVTGLSIMSVCAEADVGRTSFYNYFEDLDALREAVAIKATRTIKNRFDGLHADQPRGLKRLEGCLSMILHLAAKDRETILLVTALAETTPEIGGLLEAEIDAELAAAFSSHTRERKALARFLSVSVMALSRELAKGHLPPNSIPLHLSFLMRASRNG